MALTDIRLAYEEEVERSRLPLSDETRAGLDRYYRGDGRNSGRNTFKHISRRPIPPFAHVDAELRLVVAQTAYGKFRRGHHWRRIPDELVTNPGALRASIKARVRKYGTKDLNVARYIEVLSSVAWLHWRMFYHHDEIARTVNVPLQTVRVMMNYLRANAHRLGLNVPRKRGAKIEWVVGVRRVDPAVIHRNRSEAAKKAHARPEVKAKRRVVLLAAWERRRATDKDRWKVPNRKPRGAEYRNYMSRTMKVSWAQRKAVA